MLMRGSAGKMLKRLYQWDTVAAVAEPQPCWDGRRTLRGGVGGGTVFEAARALVSLLVHSDQ
jgi:hypothetical protein